MQYPLISEYVRAMQDSAGNLDKLAYLVPVLDDHGEPMRSSGAFAVVFKMKDESTGKEYALKCFTVDQEGRAEAYRQIADELESVDSTYVTSVKYLEKELFVDSNCDDDEFPVLLMDWIEGETMDRYIAENLYDNYAMSMLCYRFCKMAAWLRSQPFAHGDIKPDNIMVRPDGSLTLIDYDGMFAPSMKGQTSPTIGTKDFSHPLRTKDDFDETIDDFALATIALSLKAIALSPSLFDEYGSSDRLLFSADDYRDLSQSKLLTALQPLMTDSELNTLLSLFLLAHATKTLSMASFRLFSVSKPELIPVEISTEVTKEDLVEAIEDEYGVKYSKDRKRLLKAPEHIKGEYHIRKGSVCICDYAFSGCSMLKNVVIPSSVTKIGYMAFGSMDESGEYFGRSGLTSIEIPGSVIEIGDSAFSHCDDIESVKISNGVTVIGKNAFSGCYGLTSIKIPDSVTEIGAYAFSWCTGLTNIEISKSVTEIGGWTFSGCTGLTSIMIPNGVLKIGAYAFSECSSLVNVEIPNSVITIGRDAFGGCNLPENIKNEISTKPEYASNPFSTKVTKEDLDVAVEDELGVKYSKDWKRLLKANFSLKGEYYVRKGIVTISNYAFCGYSRSRFTHFIACEYMTRLVIPDGCTRIGYSAFRGCRALTSVVIPASTTRIGAYAFEGCQSLESIEIPNGVMRISNSTFKGCKSLTHLLIPDNMIEIADSAFEGCSGLTSIVIPNSITVIGRGAFAGCTGLTSVAMPDGVKIIGRFAFAGCKGLMNVGLADSITEIKEGAFRGCIGLTSVVIPYSMT